MTKKQKEAFRAKYYKNHIEMEQKYKGINIPEETEADRELLKKLKELLK